MPELPEVETIKSQLTLITPFKIKKVTYSPVVKSILKEKEFSPVKKTIISLDRKGKLLIFNLENNQHILSHLGMSGSWRISKEEILEKHTHVQFEGISEKHGQYFLAYVDPRRFGNMYYLKSKKAQEHFDRLGVDISTKDFNLEYIQKAIKRYPEKQIKPFLLDQSWFAGCGNYIASEICARAGIRPTRRCKNITKKEITKIKKATDSVLTNSIKSNGTTFAGGYFDANGDKGEGVKGLVVFYQKKCGLCNKAEVKKIILASRGTYYCPLCQS